GSNGYGSEAVLDRIGRSPARDRIQVTGDISAEELASWYARARIFAFPSLDEGFGVPVLEAMAGGIPGVTSHRAALPEGAGDAAILVNPVDTDALAAALRDLTRKSYLAEEMTARGKTRSHEFTWGKAVRETWAVYRNLLV